MTIAIFALIGVLIGYALGYEKARHHESTGNTQPTTLKALRERITHGKKPRAQVISPHEREITNNFLHGITEDT